MEAASKRAGEPTKKMKSIVRWAALGLGAEGFFGVFAAHADLGAITAAWITMFIALAAEAGTELDKATAMKIATGIVVGIGGMAAGIKMAEAWLAYTGVGTIPAMLCNAGTNAIMTYMIGNAAARVFVAQDGSACAEEVVKAIMRIVRPTPHHT